MGWMIKHYVGIARAITWIGILAIIILSGVPAADRPVIGAGQTLEHLTVFAILGCAFAIGYRLSLIKSMLLAVLFVLESNCFRSPCRPDMPESVIFLLTQQEQVLRFFAFLLFDRFQVRNCR
jgi:hypothetical protein